MQSLSVNGVQSLSVAGVKRKELIEHPVNSLHIEPHCACACLSLWLGALLCPHHYCPVYESVRYSASLRDAASQCSYTMQLHSAATQCSYAMQLRIVLTSL